MSSTTLHVIEANGDLADFATYQNSHGGAFAVWQILASKYIEGVAPVGDRVSVMTSQRYAMDKDVLRELWVLANHGGMEEYERRTIWATYDRVLIRIKDVTLYADAMATFAETYGPLMASHRYAFSIGEQAADLRRVFDERDARGWRGVGWSQIGGDAFPEQDPTTAVRRERLRSVLRDGGLVTTTSAGVDVLAASLDETLEAVIAWAEDQLDDGEERVPYNVDLHTHHSWLPGQDASALQ